MRSKRRTGLKKLIEKVIEFFEDIEDNITIKIALRHKEKARNLKEVIKELGLDE